MKKCPLSTLALLVAFGIALTGCGKTTVSTTADSGGTPSKITEAKLRLQPKVGDKWTLDVNLEMKFDTSQVKFPESPEGEAMKKQMGKESTLKGKLELNIETTEVKDGKVSFKASGKAIETEATGILQQQKDALIRDITTERTRTYSELGVVQGTEADSGSIIQFSDKPVKVGDTWEGKFSIGGPGISVTYKLVAFEQIKGKDVAKIVVQAKSLPEGTNFPTEPTFWVDLATGMSVQTDVSIVQSVPGGAKLMMKSNQKLR